MRRRHRGAVIGSAAGWAASCLLPASAAAAEEPGPPALVFAWLSGRLGTYPAAALIFLGLPILGALGKWVIDQVSAKRAKQRDFIERTGGRVVDLAWTHYWALANATGTLAGHLTQHLRMVDAHLLLFWDTPEALEERMRTIAGEAAEASFVSFVRLLHAFERFQFRGSNTYLLPHHAAGEALRRLYNGFIDSLGDENRKSLSEIRLAVERKLAAGAKEPPGLDLGSPQFETGEWFAAPADEAALQEYLDTAKARYRAWFESQPAAVADAADALRAFSRLLTHELATLHRVWHRDRGPLALREAWRQAQAAVAGERWPGVLDARSVEAIRRARSVSSFFSPLGMGTRSGRAAREGQEAEAPRQEPKDTADLAAGAGEG